MFRVPFRPVTSRDRRIFLTTNMTNPRKATEDTAEEGENLFVFRELPVSGSLQGQCDIKAGKGYLKLEKTGWPKSVLLFFTAASISLWVFVWFGYIQPYLVPLDLRSIQRKLLLIVSAVPVLGVAYYLFWGRWASELTIRGKKYKVEKAGARRLHIRDTEPAGSFECDCVMVDNLWLTFECKAHVEKVLEIYGAREEDTDMSEATDEFRDEGAKPL